MIFTEEERQMLAIYYYEDRTATIKSLQEMMTYLEPDETELKELTEKVIRKLSAMTDRQYAAFDPFIRTDGR